MRIIYVDDEESAHINFKFHIQGRNDLTSVAYFFDYKDTMQYAKENPIDCAFLDVDLPDGNGIELAIELKKLQPNMEVVFITSYDEFARNAYKVGGRGYLTKPYTTEELDETILRVGVLLAAPVSPQNIKCETSIFHVYAKTFGNFDLLIDGKPMHFKNGKAKELFAFLVNQVGGTVSSAQIFFAMWEQQEYTKSTSTYVRRTIRALKDELNANGIGYVLMSQRNSISIDVSYVGCDYYDLLQGDMKMVQQYNGRYMSQYSWGEETIPVIERVVASMEKASNSQFTPPADRPKT